MKYFIGQHVIASGNINTGADEKGVLSWIDGVAVAGEWPYQLSNRWYSSVKLDPDFKAENDKIAGVKPTHLTSFDGVKVGTKLKIREDLKEGVWHNGDLVNDQMASRAGEEVTVNQIITRDRVYLNEVSYLWSHDMFECIVPGTENIVDTLYTISKQDFVFAVEDEDICTAWKTRLIGWVVEAGEYSFTLKQINEMKDAADAEQMEQINQLFPKLAPKSLGELLKEASGIYADTQQGMYVLKCILEEYILDNK